MNMKPPSLLTSRSRLGLLIAAALALNLVISNSASAQGILYVVDSTGDGDLVGPSTDCDDGTGHCTLRAAIEASNLHVGTDGIAFSIPTTDPGYSNGVWTIIAFTALPNIIDAVNINGPGAAQLHVQAYNSRVFNVTTTGTVNFTGLQIAAGSAPANQGGAGIQNLNSGTINVTNCSLYGNYAGSGNSAAGGGGIFNASNGTVNVSNSTFDHCHAIATGGLGGGIYNPSGTVHVSNTTFQYCSSTESGGGIYNGNGPNGSAVLTVSGCTFHDDIAYLGGGGIENAFATATVTNSTFYANVASGSDPGGIHGEGGALFNRGNGTLNISNCTVTANFSAAVGSGVFSEPGFTGVLKVKSTIIASNYGGTSEFGKGTDVYGAFKSAGFNLIGKKDGSTGFSAATDKKGTIKSPLDPKLDPKGLQNNGGPTQTVALVAGSPAIDQGTSASLTGQLTTDQRGTGFPRKVDKAVANASGGDGTDIGAFEVQ